VDAGVDAARDASRPDGSTPDAPTQADLAPPSDDATDAQPSTLAGTFAVHSLFDTSASAASPGPVRNALTLMHSLVDDPGAAILAFADQAGVPAATTLRAALPSALLNGLTGWMNSYIKTAGSNGVVPYDRLVWLDDTVRTLLLYWNLDSRLALPAGSGTHTPRVLGFNVSSGSPVLYAIDPTLLTPATNVTAALSWPDGDAAPPLATLSDHSFALPFGRYAAPALDAILLAKYGTPTLAAYLSDSVGCAGLAESVAAQCVSVVCVGHASEVAALCEGGLAEGARQIDAQIQSIDLKAIHFQRGTATAVSSEGANPQPLAAMKNGVWTVTVDFGNGPEPANATFSAGPETTTRF
jgi:hypothetical protein